MTSSSASLPLSSSVIDPIPALTSEFPSLSLDSGGLDDENSNSSVMITLISKEKQKFQCPRKAAMMSELCKTTLEGGKEANREGGRYKLRIK